MLIVRMTFPSKRMYILCDGFNLRCELRDFIERIEDI